MPCELGVLEPRRLDDRPVMLDGQNKFVQLGSAGVDDADSGTATWQCMRMLEQDLAAYCHCVAKMNVASAHPLLSPRTSET